MSSLKVLIYAMNYAPELAGVGKYSGEIGAFLATRGCEVRVITTPAHYPGWKVIEKPNERSSEEVDGVRVERFPLYLHPDMHGLKRLLAPLSFAWNSGLFALKTCFAFRPDIVLAVEPTLFVAPAALLGAKFCGARTVLHVQDLEIDAAFGTGHLSNPFIRKFVTGIEGLILRRFDKLITIADAMAEKLAAKGVDRGRISVVRNWVDVDHIKPEQPDSSYRLSLGLAAEHFIVLYSGNIGAKQGVGLLIEAARRMNKDDRVIFVIAGEGPMRGQVEAAATQMTNLKVLPFQPYSQFSQFLGMADCHALPQEAGAADLMLPSKLGGLLASGKPVVVTADQKTELGAFLGSSCILTPPGDVSAFVSAIRALQGEAFDEGRTERLRLAAHLSKNGLIQRFFDVLTAAKR